MPWIEPVPVKPLEPHGPRVVRLARSGLEPPWLRYDGSDWHLVRAYAYHADEGVTLTIPEGEATDLSSIPRWLWPLCAPFELSVVAPLVHDFVYRRGGKVRLWTKPERDYTRLEADRLFRRIMDIEGVPDCRRRLAYPAVRLFAGPAWRDPAWIPS